MIEVIIKRIVQKIWKMNITTVFPQLNSDNFHNWKFRVSALLEEKRLEETLTKEESDFEVERDKINFKINDAKAKSIIIQCVTDKHLDIIKDSATAKNMMKSLEGVFQRKSVFSKLTLKKKLLTMKCGRNERLEDHFQKFDNVMRELESVGSKVDESDKVCHLLLSLNEDYGPVITAIETLNSEVTMEFVKSRLLDEELKIKSKVKLATTESAFKTNNQYVCFKCGKPGHRIANCTEKGDRRRQNFTNRGRGRGFASQTNGRQQANEAANSKIAFLALNCVLKDKNSFILDSGASEHLIRSKLEEFMINVVELDKEINIGTACTKNILKAKKKGMLVGICQGKEITIEALIVEGLSHNLISVTQLLKKQFKVIFENKELGVNKAMIIKDKNIFYCESINDLFVIKIDFKNEMCYEACNNKSENNSDIWHRRLGHINRYNLKLLGLPFSKKICKYCIEGKSIRKHFDSCTKRTKNVGELIHTDIAGPVVTPTVGGYKYFQVIIDDYSHFLIIKLLKNKGEAEQNLIDYIKMLKPQFGHKTKRIRCDNGGEFSSNFLKQLQ